MLDPLTVLAEEITFAVILSADAPGRRLVGPIHMPEYRHEFLVMAVTERQEYAMMIQTALERLYQDLYNLETPTGIPLHFDVVSVIVEPPAPTRDACPWCNDTY